MDEVKPIEAGPTYSTSRGGGVEGNRLQIGRIDKALGTARARTSSQQFPKAESNQHLYRFGPPVKSAAGGLEASYLELQCTFESASPGAQLEP